MRTGALLLAALAALSTCVDAVFPSVPLPKRSAQVSADLHAASFVRPLGGGIMHVRLV